MTAEPAFDALEATRRERLDLCDHLDTLGPEQWQVPSLCDGWTVKDVVAHLTTSTRTTFNISRTDPQWLSGCDGRREVATTRWRWQPTPAVW